MLNPYWLCQNNTGRTTQTGQTRSGTAIVYHHHHHHQQGSRKVTHQGPLAGLRIIELVGLGPGPFVGMMLADMGAEVIAIDRLGKSEAPQLCVDIHRRGKRSMILDLKSAEGKAVFLQLCAGAAAVFEGFRPGVMEKLGLGPEVCLQHNPALVYGRMTGWGQTGPLAPAAGHDINYLAITGALHAMGARDSAPVPPLNLVGDYAGGMFLAYGLVCAILSSKTSGAGQVIDAAMVDGVNVMMTLFHSLLASAMWNKERSSNFLDGGAPYYRCYVTRDDKFIALGAIERPFMQIFTEKSGASADLLQGHTHPHLWPQHGAALAALFRTRTQQAWCELLEGTDACFAPVIPFWEAHQHAHNIARGNFTVIDGVIQPSPAPRFSATPAAVTRGPVAPGADTHAILQALGYDPQAIEALQASGAVS
jgi:alpha-methylacyl-CoA racemase